MSPSDDLSLTDLTLRFNLPVGVDPRDLRFSVYDGWENLLPKWNKRTLEDFNNPVLRLPIGIYTVRWEYGDILDEKVIRLPQQKEVEISVLLQTPAPVPGAADTHEYYSTYNGTIARDEKTGVPLGDAGKLNSRLHLLLRSRNHESYHGEDLADGLVLLDENLKPLYEMKSQARVDTWGGSLLCSLPATSRRYVLEYRGGPSASAHPEKLPRLFPLHLFAGWETRLFIFFDAGQPNFASASLSLVRLGYDDSYDFERRERLQIDAAFDMALKGLQNNILELPKQIEQILLMGKFDNPMMGLLGAHYLLRHPKASASNPAQESHWRDTADMVLSNMEYLLPDSPDLMALRYKAALRFAGDGRFSLPSKPVGKLPLLRASVEALLEADSDSVVAIEEGSLLERLAPNLYFDSPWATFQPLMKKQADTPWGAPGESRRDIESEDAYYDEPAGWEGDDWLENSVQQALKYTTTQKGKGADPDWNRLSTSLGVPYRRMMRVVQMVKNQQTQIGGMGNVQADQIEASNSQIGGSGNTQINAQNMNSNNITVGDINGSTGVVVGRNNVVTVTTQGTPLDEFDKVFTDLQKMVSQMPAGDERSEARDAVDKLQAEAKKRNDANETRILKYLNFLFETAPDIWQVAVDTFISPIKGLSTVFMDAAKHAKAEKGK